LAFVRPYTAGSEYYVRYSQACEGCEAYEVCVYYMDTDPDEISDYCTISGGHAECEKTSCNEEFPTSLFATCYDTEGLGTCKEIDVQNNINSIVLDEVRIQLATLFGTALFIQNFLEVFIPWVIGRIKGDQAAKEYAKTHGDGAEFIRSDAEIQMEKAPYASTIDDMSELIVQFGYVTLFVLALPITPLCALINNVAEMRVDAFNLLNATQRPNPNGSFGLGAWNSVLQFFSFICVGTNVAICTWRTELVSSLFSENSEYKWIFFSVICVVLGLILAFEKFIIPDVPLDVEQAMARQENLEGVLVKGQRIDADRDAPPDDDDAGYLDFNPSAEFIDVETLPDIPCDGPLALWKP